MTIKLKTLLLCFLIAILSVFCACSSVAPSLENEITFSSAYEQSSASKWIVLPRQILMNDSEIANPLRGQYIWNGQLTTPKTWPAQDVYDRFNWSEIEAKRGQIRFDLIDKRLKLAKSLHGRFGMRIMALNQGWSPTLYKGAHSAMPQDLADSVNVLIGHAAGDTALYAIPDWNHPHYWKRLRELLESIAQHYKDDPTFAFVDVSSYGNWGEFHLYPFDRAGGVYDTSLQQPLSDSSKQMLIRMNAEIFKNKILLLNTESEAAVEEAVNTKDVMIGLRTDCLGSDNLGGGELAILKASGGRDLWKRAPLVSEWCQHNLGSSGANLFEQGLSQVKEFHYSMLSSANFDKIPSTESEVQSFRMANMISGYRISPDSIVIQKNNSHLIIQSRWINTNVAPLYLNFKTQWVVNGQKQNSQIDLRKLLPNLPITIIDTILIQDIKTKDKLDISVLVEDVQGISFPLSLAIEGRQTDGRYPIFKE